MTSPADESRPDAAPSSTSEDNCSEPTTVAAPSIPEKSLPLMAEVQTFLATRDELAKKLAEEIAATEKKLAELKRTAAMLYPAAVAPPGKEKKAKKVKARAAAAVEPADETRNGEGGERGADAAAA